MSDSKKSKKSENPSTSEAEQALEYTFVSISDLPGGVAPATVNPRDLIEAPFDSRAQPVKLDPSFLSDVQQNGILQSLLAVPVRNKKTGEVGLMLIAGRTRRNAALELSLKSVPVLVKEMTFLEAALACGSENLKRQNLSFYDEACYYRDLMATHRLKGVELAAKLSVSSAKITQYTMVFKLDPRVQKLIQKGNLAGGVATKIRDLAKIEDPEVQYEVALRAAKEEWDSRDIEDFVNKYLAKEAEKAERAAAREKEKAKKERAAKRAAAGEPEEEEEEEKDEKPASKFDPAKVVPIKKGELLAMLDRTSLRLQKLRANGADDAKIQYEQGFLNGLKSAASLKALPKSIGGDEE